MFTLGTVLMRSAGCCANDVADREFDRHVKRTAQRPVTSGALSPQEALRFGAVLAFVAFLLVLTTNLATIMWSVVALAVSIFYPFTKRFFWMPQAFLGVAFSMGIPMAYAAIRGHVPPIAWALVAANFFWTLAKRHEKSLYVAIWFYIATIITVAMLYIVNHLSIPTSLTHSYPPIS